MSSAKNTPGPWRLHAGAYVKRGHIGISAKDHDFLAQVVVRMEDDEDDSPALVANARLIAAAPDLLEALQDMHQVLQEAMSTGGWVPTPVQASFRAAWVDMAAAIAKANGAAS